MLSELFAPDRFDIFPDDDDPAWVQDQADQTEASEGH